MATSKPIPLASVPYVESRQVWPAVPPEFEKRLNDHMSREEQREKEDAVRQALDAKRFDDGAKTMKQLADDLAPIKKMYYAVVGCGILGTAMLAMGAYIYSNDRNDAKVDRGEMKALAGALTEQSSAIRVMLSRMQDFKEEQDRMRGMLEKMK